MPIFRAEELRKAGAAVLGAAGAPPEEALIVARELVEANLVGHDSHGVIRIPQYVDSMRRGEIDPGRPVEIANETAVALLLDGRWGFGQVIGHRAVDLAVARAKGEGAGTGTGLAAVTIRHSNHIGRLGSYVEAVARRGLIGLLFANAHGAGPVVVPWGGRHGRLSTNPLAVGIPRDPDDPIVLDMTTSIVAEGKIRVKRNRGEQTPEGWIVDREGVPTTDPVAFYGPPRGGILPFGGSAGHKGFGLSVAVDLLAGALSGAGCTGTSDQVGNAVLLLVLDIAAFVPPADFEQEVGAFVSWIKSAPTAAGIDEILVPGEIESRERARRRRDGIFVEDETWRQICEYGSELGLELS